MVVKELLSADGIRNRIYTIRSLQVMIDSDLAELYQVEVKMLNRAVKRNLDRFPQEFMFQLTEDEFQSLQSSMECSKNGKPLRFQNGTLNNEMNFISQSKRRGQHRKYYPYAFTEQGVAMLSAVLRSETAVKVSIRIINAFVSMRKFIGSNAQIFHRLDVVEKKQIDYKADSDRNFEKIFNAIEAKEIVPRQGIFFNGQIFDAYKFVSDLFRTAKKSIIIIGHL